jgi:hypothetical protein
MFIIGTAYFSGIKQMTGKIGIEDLFRFRASDFDRTTLAASIT